MTRERPDFAAEMGAALEALVGPDPDLVSYYTDAGVHAAFYRSAQVLVLERREAAAYARGLEQTAARLKVIAEDDHDSCRPADDGPRRRPCETCDFLDSPEVAALPPVDPT